MYADFAQIFADKVSFKDLLCENLREICENLRSSSNQST